MPGFSSSIRRQLLIGLLLPLTGLWIISSVIAYNVAFSFATEAYDRALFDSALDLSRQLKIVNDSVVLDVPPVALDMLESDEFDRVYYQVRGARGEFVMGYRGLPDPPQTEPKKPIYYDASYRNQHIRVVAFYVPVPPEHPTDLALVQVAETVLKRQILAREILVGLALPQLLLIALACLSVWHGVGRGLTPLEALRSQIQSRSHRDLSPITEETTPREVQPLVHAINDLLTRLSAGLSTQQRFIADAAHQLRTPIAGLKTQTELALRQNDLAEVHRTLRQLQTATERGTHLVNQLLSLARVEPGAARLRPMQPLDLAELAREVTTQWVPQALARNIDLGFEAGPQPALLLGDDLLLREMLANLIDNAIRYTQEGGRVTTRVSGGGKVVLSVEDNGPGIPPSEREQVFERFHRVIGSGADGCGLGLAIVREIVQGHGAEITLDSPADATGTLVKVIFPTAEAETKAA
jgi:two-component system sensor histidine kinase TctE